MKIIRAFEHQKTKIKNLLFKSLHLHKIKSIVWDIDGTMYNNLDLGKEIYSEYILFIAGKKKMKNLKTAGIMLEQYAARGMTWSQAAARLTGTREIDILKRVGRNIDRSKFLKTDESLISMFSSKKIQHYTHFILTNSTKRNAIQTLNALGLTEKIVKFERIICVEDFKYVKPHPSCFEMVLNITRTPAETHLMVGDDMVADIIPAKKIGMKTCLMNSNYSVFDGDLLFADIKQLYGFLR